MKHTKGPWYESNTGNHQGLIISENTGENIAVSYDKKNARLIAAAPDLYFACRAALLTLEDDENYYKYKDVVDTLRQAISKATKEDT